MRFFSKLKDLFFSVFGPLSPLIIKTVITFLALQFLNSVTGLRPSLTSLQILANAFIVSVILETLSLFYRIDKFLPKDNLFENYVGRSVMDVFYDYFEPIFSVIKDVPSGTFTVQDNTKESFYRIYCSVLRHLKGGSIKATSSLNRNYFWDTECREGSVEDATRHFIEETGASIERIFIITSSDREDVERITNVLSLQKSCGVDVWCIDEENITDDKYKQYFLFCYSSQLDFAWRVNVSPSNRIVRMTVTFVPEKINSLEKIHSGLKRQARPLDTYLNALSI